MALSTNTQSSLFVRVADWIKADAERKHEPASVSRLDLQRMARELSIGEADLRAVIPFSPQRTEQDHAAPPVPVLTQRLVRNCARCRPTGRCRYGLAQGKHASEASEYCVNVEAFDLPAPN